jgi:3-methyladenine DNA glycosylase/8-oxoguanine DNA glycosylase
MPGLRITRTLAVFEALVPTILAQRVTGLEAGRSYRALVLALGEPAPGPTPPGLLVPPSPGILAALPYYRFHPFGIEMRRANTIRGAAARAPRLEAWTALPPGEARRLITTLPGLGEWTVAEVAIVALGDADAVSVGDYHIPDTVAWALAGEARADDDRMLQLLEPFAGHRGRVIRLIEAAGISAPRYGPKSAVRSFRSI